MKKKSVKKSAGHKLNSPLLEKEIALDFAVKAQKKFDQMIKASVLFGSQAKNTAHAKSDIDIIFIIDDASINWDLELISWYREELGKLLGSETRGQDIHVNTIKLTTWWLDLLHGDPVVLNIIRYGEPLIDIGGFFAPLKALLLQGKIAPTPEAVYVALQRAPNHLLRSRVSQMGAIEGVYWTMVDSAQAALIMAGKMPPSPEHIPEYLQATFVEPGMLKSGFARAFADLYQLYKGISHGNIHIVSGVEVDKWQSIAEKFLAEMTQIIKKLSEPKT
jgi:predicted nucleotidyltransferase